MESRKKEERIFFQKILEILSPGETNVGISKQYPYLVEMNVKVHKRDGLGKLLILFIHSPILLQNLNY